MSNIIHLIVPGSSIFNKFLPKIAHLYFRRTLGEGQEQLRRSDSGQIDPDFNIWTNKIHEKTKISLELGKKGYIISEKYVLDKSGTKIKAEEPNATNKKTKIIFELEPMTVNHFVLN